jgi:hypothetical protein
VEKPQHLSTSKKHFPFGKTNILPNFAIHFFLKEQTNIFMGMNKNTILGWATFVMVLMGLLLIGLGIFRYDDVAGWGFGAVGIGFFAIAWVFSSLKGRV